MRRVLLGVAVMCIAAIPAASAHTSLVASTPSNNAVLANAPKQIKMTFNEKLVNLAGKPINRITLKDSKSQTISLPKATLSGNSISVSLPILTKGRYVASYRVVSGDGHPVTGTIKFRITK